MNEKKFVTNIELGKILDVAPCVIQGWCTRGYVRHYKRPTSNAYLYDLDECMAYYQESAAKHKKDRGILRLTGDQVIYSTMLDDIKSHITQALTIINTIGKDIDGK
jgi:hypothetical protein